MTTATRRRDAQAIGRGTPQVYLSREEWAVLQSWHPNVLIAGPESATNAALIGLNAVLRPSTAYWHGDPALPSFGLDAPQTLIVRDVSTLSKAEQRRLLDWLRANQGFTQIVSLSTVRLLEFVEKGAFDPELYYALNVVFCDLFE